jgi:cardiolipin synthase
MSRTQEWLFPVTPPHRSYVGLPEPRLLPAEEYIADAARAVRSARHRVVMIALTISDGRETSALLDALMDAARRGVDVRVAADVFTYADVAGTFLPRTYLTRRARKSMRLVRDLKEAGATFDWLGRDRGIIFRGRTHTKFCVVDDTSYSFGGVNVDDAGATNVDYMLRVDDRQLADDLVWIYSTIQKANIKKVGHRSRSLKYGKDRVLVDGGLVGDSIIYRHACRLAAKAERIVLVSQYCPTGKLGRLIKAVPHSSYFNPPENASPLNALLIRASMMSSRTGTLYRRKRYLHAKVILFYLPGHKKVAITGSHNFVLGGVSLGTREIALQTKNPKVIEQIERFIAEHVR